MGEKEDAKDYSGESRSLQLTTHRPGGEVLALGTDMDEVVFCEHPQLLVLLQIVDKLKADASEHLLIRGVTRYSVLVGQGANLKCERGVVDSCPIGQDAIRMRELCTCFAVAHKNEPEKQFGITEMHADINRIYASLRAGFAPVKEEEEEYEEEEEDYEGEGEAEGDGEGEGEAEGEGDAEAAVEVDDAGGEEDPAADPEGDSVFLPSSCDAFSVDLTFSSFSRLLASRSQAYYSGLPTFVFY